MDEKRAKEQELDFKNFMENYPDTFKEEYPKKEESAKDDYYIDQAPYNLRFHDRHFSSCYTPFGISRMDSWISDQIMHGSKYTFEELEKMIRRNPHFHNVIKTNLLSNLKAYDTNAN